MDPSAFGQAVTFTAKVTPATATGAVQFLDGTTALGTGTVTGGAASLSVSSLAVGAHSITAAYAGNAQRRRLPDRVFQDPVLSARPLTVTTSLRSIDLRAGRNLRR